ncbi:serine protease [Zafaria cholistanensis]|uniref:Serine protease n=1 Tax=Zafaria cholistanensis TaxID=1682741 RepID=A0A5A7NVK2_9MICC|nr:trypsin-like peptidase domain-containing protein [Zafaria cholistanensis]GER24151.1 serine protease [Zafaria cholistanensis]
MSETNGTTPTGADSGPAVPPRPDTPPLGPGAPQPPYSSWNATAPIPTGGAAFGYPSPHAPAPKKQPRRFGAPVLIGGMLAAALVGGGTAVATGYAVNASGPAGLTAVSGQPVVINNPENVTAVTAAAAKASPSVVTIEVSGGNASGSGSGIILDAAGHILTNTHVVTLGGEVANPAIAVRTSDGQVHDAKVVGTDPLSDLAVIKIDAANLTAATLGSSSSLNVGDTAIAIGAPLGLSGTVTDGIVSTLNRTISIASSAVPDAPAEGSQDSSDDEFNFQFPGQQEAPSGQGSIAVNVIQTDAAINQGNSGGALVDVNGDIIGVNVAIASASSGSTASGDSGNIGVGFAVPIDYAKRIANDLVAHGTATHGLLGVTVQAKAADTASGSTSFSVGAEVRSVSGGSPAEKAGLKQGDIITGVGDRSVEDSLSLTAVIREYAAGSQAKVHFTRDGQPQSVDVTVAEVTE